MNRKEFFAAAAKAGVGCCALAMLSRPAEAAASTGDAEERAFVTNWLNDLFEAFDVQLDPATKSNLMGACGRACFRRHAFKTDIAREGHGDIDKLLAAMKGSFEVWRDGDLVHVRFGKEVKQCFCPAARYHDIRSHDIHCECSRATQQAIFETALERPVKVEVVQSVRHGDKTCHFIAHLA